MSSLNLVLGMRSRLGSWNVELPSCAAASGNLESMNLELEREQEIDEPVLADFRPPGMVGVPTATIVNDHDSSQR